MTAAAASRRVVPFGGPDALVISYWHGSRPVKGEQPGRHGDAVGHRHPGAVLAR